MTRDDERRGAVQVGHAFPQGATGVTGSALSLRKVYAAPISTTGAADEQTTRHRMAPTMKATMPSR